jgi:non-ribosomal peptide synthetase component F
MRSDEYGPLSFQQRQIWLAEQGAAGTGLYNEACALRLRGPLALSNLDGALTTVVERNDALRTTFPLLEGEPVQRVSAPYRISLTDGLTDLSHLPEPARHEELLSLAQQHAEAPFDLADGPLVRFSLIRLGTEDHVLLLVLHHIVADGRSLRLVLGELAEWYRRLCAGVPATSRPVPARYLDFARSQRAAEEAGGWDDELTYWRDHLAGAPTVAELPPDRPRPPLRGHRGRRHEHRADERTRAALARLTDAASGSRLAALAALFAVLVYRYTGRTDLLVGTGTDTRPGRYDQTVGLFANLVPLRLRSGGDLTVRAVLDSASDTVFDALDNALVPFEKIVEVAAPDRDPSHPQLVQLICTVWDRDYARMSLGDVEATLVEIPRARARFDLMVEHIFDPGAWTMWTEYDAGLFEPATVERMMRHYAQLIRAAAAEPDATVAALEMLPVSEVEAARAPGRLVLDRDGNVAPVGAVGELHEQTPDSVPVPTGQAARRLGNGDVETLGLLSRRVRLGQLDTQLEHLESLAREHPAVQDARADLSGSRPVLYVVSTDPTISADVRSFLEARLPRAQVPAIVADRSPGGTRSAPRPLSTLERAVAGVWEKLLSRTGIAADDDFFALGGRSMVAAHAAQRLSEELGVPVRVRDIFVNPTVRELAAVLAGASPAAPPERDVPAAGAPADRVPVSMAQLQIWLNEQWTLGAGDDFNSAFAHRVRGPLDVAALHAALCGTVTRHPSLRTYFEVVDDLPEQRVVSEVPVDLPLVDLEYLPPPRRPAEALRLARAAAAKRFDIGTPPLLRALLIRIGADDHVLAYTMHHLVTDGVSMGVFQRELSERYAARLAGRTPTLPPTGAAYADYVSWEREWLAGSAAETAREYWRTQLSDLVELCLPTTRGTDRAGPAVASCRRGVPGDVTRDLVELSRRCRATAFMTVTAAWSLVLGRWSGQRDVVVGTLVDNRPSEALRATIGCFANFVPLRITRRAGSTFPQLVGHVRDVLLGAYEHQHLPFSEIVRVSGARRSYTRMPVFQTTVQSVHPAQRSLAVPGCRTQPWTVTADVSRYELTLFVTEDERNLVLDLEYATDLWDRETIGSRLDELVEILGKAVRTAD